MQPLLESLCRGVSDQEVPAALQGLLAHSAHTRFAALTALPLLPCLAQSMSALLIILLDVQCMPGQMRLPKSCCQKGGFISTLNALQTVAGHFSGGSKQAATLWLACHDTDRANSEAAHKLVAEADVDFPQDFVSPLADVLSHDSSDVRQAAAEALACGIKVIPKVLSCCCHCCHLDVLTGTPSSDG